jgi:hypothetical protein
MGISNLFAKSLWAGDRPAPDQRPNKPQPPAVPRKKPQPLEEPEQRSTKGGMSPAAPATTQIPRTRLLLKLLSDRIGEWIPAREAAELVGAQYAVYIQELQAQGRPISKRVEYHGEHVVLCWFRLNRTATW